jgi:hypothetical protein
MPQQKSSKCTAQSSQSLRQKMSANWKTPIGLTAIGIIGVVLLGGGTALASNASKPGDFLYSVDLWTEDVQLAFSLSDDMKQGVYVGIAQERLVEIQQLFAQDEVNAPGIAIALANFEEKKHAATDLANNDDEKTELEDEFEAFESTIDGLFESQQKTLEDARESLEKQAEAAEKDGNTELAALLRAQARALDSQLNVLEAKREASKQEQEKYRETVKSGDDGATSEGAKDADEAEGKQQEALKESVEKELEAQEEARKQLEEQKREAAKEAEERRQEAAKEEQERQEEAAKEAAEREKDAQED